MIEGREKVDKSSRRVGFDEAPRSSEGSLKEDPKIPGTYTGYTRNPPRKERN
jgi:hypothetical protein